MLRATGLDDEAIAKPLVAVVHTWSNVSPCNLNLRELAERPTDGIRAAGGTPIEFNTIAVTDGIAMGTPGHARLADQPRGDHRLDRAGGGRPLPRRDGGAVRLRQDHPRRRDGAGAAEHPRRGAVRRHHRPRHPRQPSDHHPAGVRGGRRARRRQDRRRRADLGRARRLPRRRRLRRPVHRQHDGDGADRRWACRRWASTTSPPPIRPRARRRTAAASW